MSLLETVLSLVVGFIAAAVAGNELLVYRKRKGLRHLLWGVGLSLWAISAFGQGYALILAWTIPIYKLYYFSAISLAGFLGAGTLGLIIAGRLAFKVFTAFIVGVTAILAVAISLATVNEEILKEAVIGGLALPSSVRLFAPLINIPGGITFIGGAGYSFFRTRKLYALLITLGALTPALGGVSARFEVPFLLPFTDFLGILLLSIGIYLSGRN